MMLFRYVCLLGLIGAGTAWAQDYVPGEVIVRLKSQVGSQASYAFLGKAHSQKEMNLKRSWGKLNMHHFQVKPGQSVEQAVAELKSDPDVLYAEPNYIFRKSTDFEAERVYNRDQVMAIAQGDPTAAYETQIGLAEVYQSMQSFSGDYRPIVAIIDTGLDVNHPVFVDSNALWINEDEIAGNGIDDDGNGYVDDVNGYNFAYNSSNVWDDDGHGTHVAGIVLKVGLDIMEDPIDQSAIRIMALKFLDGSGMGTTSDAIEAIYYALNNGAVVLNNSWGGPSYSAALLDAVVATYDRGATFVAAAGNSATNNDAQPMYPATYNVPHVLSIAATTNLDYLAYFSNFGVGTVHVGSPGLNVLSTYPGGTWTQMSGTSMAAPFVSGIAALMKASAPEMLGYQVKSIIDAEADPVSHLINKVMTEARVNASASIIAAGGAAIETSQPAYDPSYMSRELASELTDGGGGCGLVSKLYQEFNNGQGRGGPPPLGRGLETWYILVILALFALPIALRTWLRSRDPVNRRRHPRYDIQTAVTMNLDGRKLVGEVSSISLGGVRIDTNAWLDQGGVVNMTITSPDGKDQVQVEGKVVWSEAQKSYGVAFDEEKTGPLALSAISKWTKGLKKAS
ncbi:MAG: S8 family serine peptidase [Bdellovibrionaceae bacterium]|nr:S8 family serine peptidase [Bdellovibrionales bacterium]MCB9082825.1 S8 family serine peptidase [Pseudobdellovibrionaceae bacterium]